MPASKAKRAEVAQRRTKAIQLNLAGVPYDRIAEQLGYKSRQAARVDVQRALEQSLKEQSHAVELAREKLLQQYDRLLQAMWTGAMVGDQGAAKVSLQILLAKAKALGTDAPTRIEMITIDQIDAQINELRQKMAENDRESGSVQAFQA